MDLLKPDMDRFHELVAALCDRKMVAGAQKVLNDMRKAGAVPLRKTYLSLLELFAREGLWRDAEALRKDMVSAGLDPNGKVRLYCDSICDAPLLDAVDRRCCCQAELEQAGIEQRLCTICPGDFQSFRHAEGWLCGEGCSASRFISTYSR